MPHLGKELFEKAVQAVDPQVKNSSYLRMRTAGRLLEEVVELCLESGQIPETIIGHVMDAIHSECLKSKSYPSRLPNKAQGKEDIIDEITDVFLLLDMLLYFHGVNWSQVYLKARDKTEMLIERSKFGEAIVVDGLLYGKGKR